MQRSLSTRLLSLTMHAHYGVGVHSGGCSLVTGDEEQIPLTSSTRTLIIIIRNTYFINSLRSRACQRGGHKPWHVDILCNQRSFPNGNRQIILSHKKKRLATTISHCTIPALPSASFFSFFFFVWFNETRALARPSCCFIF